MRARTLAERPCASNRARAGPGRVLRLGSVAPQSLRCRAEDNTRRGDAPMPYRVLTPDSHGDETMQIAYDMLPDGLRAGHRAARPAGILEPAEGCRFLYRRRPVQARPGILRPGAEAEARADPERRLQHLRSRRRPRRRRADLQQWRRQRDRGRRARDHADAGGVAQADLGARRRHLRALARQRLQLRPSSTSWRTRPSASSASAISARRSRAAPRRSTCGSIITTSTA